MHRQSRHLKEGHPVQAGHKHSHPLRSHSTGTAATAMDLSTALLPSDGTICNHALLHLHR